MAKPPHKDERPKTWQYLEVNVKRLIKDDLKIAQNKFAEGIGMAGSTLSAALTAHEPGFKVLERIADGLGCSVGEILSDPEKREIKARIIEHDIAECFARVQEHIATGKKPPEPKAAMIEAKPADPLFNRVISAWGKLTDDTQRKHIVRQIENLVGGLSNTAPISNPTEPDKKPGKS